MKPSHNVQDRDRGTEIYHLRAEFERACPGGEGESATHYSAPPVMTANGMVRPCSSPAGERSW